VRRTENRVNALVRWQWNRATDDSACSRYRAHNLLGGLVYQIVIVRLELDADFLRHDFFL
jgi:hypothetical protein